MIQRPAPYVGAGAGLGDALLAAFALQLRDRGQSIAIATHNQRHLEAFSLPIVQDFLDP
jgi:hypothetical protein